VVASISWGRRRPPDVSNLNPARGKTVPNAVYTLLGPANGLQVYNNGAASMWSLT
jgi:hypothetical protein